MLVASSCSRNIGKIENGYTNFGNLKIAQFERPKIGEEIAVITTEKGVIKMKLFDEDYGFTPDVIKAYSKIGGLPEIHKKGTTFAQVFYGMDTLFEINRMPVDSNRLPIGEPVVVEKIEIVPYEVEI